MKQPISPHLCLFTFIVSLGAAEAECFGDDRERRRKTTDKLTIHLHPYFIVLIHWSRDDASSARVVNLPHAEVEAVRIGEYRQRA